MIDPTEHGTRRHAVPALAPLGDYVASIGMERPAGRLQPRGGPAPDRGRGHRLPGPHARCARTPWRRRTRLLRGAAGAAPHAAPTRRCRSDARLQPPTQTSRAGQRPHRRGAAAENASADTRATIWAARASGVACERALQFEYAGRPGRRGRGLLRAASLRIFEVGHALEDLAIRWLRLAGFDLYTRKEVRRRAVRLLGRRRPHPGPCRRHHRRGTRRRSGSAFPALWECKTMNDKIWRDTVKQRRGRRQAGLCRPDRGLPGLHGGRRSPASPTTRRCSPRSTRTPRRSSSNWCRSTAGWRSACPTARCG